MSNLVKFITLAALGCLVASCCLAESTTSDQDTLPRRVDDSGYVPGQNVPADLDTTPRLLKSGSNSDDEDTMPRKVDNSGYVPGKNVPANLDTTPRLLKNATAIRGPSFVCKPNCGYYASIGDYESFMNDRCCIFIQCPNGPAYNKKSYQCFKQEYCSNNTGTTGSSN